MSQQQPQHKAFTGRVTKLLDNFGFVDDDVFFQLRLDFSSFVPFHSFFIPFHSFFIPFHSFFVPFHSFFIPFTPKMFLSNKIYTSTCYVVLCAVAMSKLVTRFTWTVPTVNTFPSSGMQSVSSYWSRNRTWVNPHTCHIRES